MLTIFLLNCVFGYVFILYTTWDQGDDISLWVLFSSVIISPFVLLITALDILNYLISINFVERAWKYPIIKGRGK